MREALINKIVDIWRRAENTFLETEDDTAKWKAKQYQDKCRLTAAEEKEVQKRCDAVAV